MFDKKVSALQKKAGLMPEKLHKLMTETDSLLAMTEGLSKNQKDTGDAKLQKMRASYQMGRYDDLIKEADELKSKLTEEGGESASLSCVILDQVKLSAVKEKERIGAVRESLDAYSDACDTDKRASQIDLNERLKKALQSGKGTDSD